MNSQVTIPGASAASRPCTRLGDRSRRVLLAEDDEDLRRLIAAVLRRVGYDVAEARDGIEVVDRIASTIQRARRHPFRAIVSDMNMPGLTGLDLLAALRRSRLDTPVILITAFSDVQSRAKASELGAFAYLEKPLNVAQLRDAVARAMALSSDVLAVEVARGCGREGQVSNPSLALHRRLVRAGGHGPDLLRIRVADHFGCVQRREAEVPKRRAARIRENVRGVRPGWEGDVVARPERDRGVSDAHRTCALEDEQRLLHRAVEVPGKG
jgi:CheY-like chemotaxis protein